MEALKFIFRLPALPVAILYGIYLSYRIEQNTDPLEFEMNESLMNEDVEKYIDESFPIWVHNAIAIIGWLTILKFVL